MAILRYNPDARPNATIALVIVNIAIAVLDIATDGMLERMFWARGVDIYYGEFWRLFTSAWVHANLMHIAFNAYGLYILGSILERMIGARWMLVTYFVSLFGGSGLAMMFYDSNTALLGASGAVYGLFGGVLGVMYATTGSLKGLTRIPMGRMLLLWLGFGIYISVAMPGISLLGHLGGLVPGALLGIYFEHRWRKQVDLYHHLTVGVIAVGIVAACALSVYPPTRAALPLAQALKAYEAGDFERGDELVSAATSKRMDDGARDMLAHLRLWREANESNPAVFDNSVLRWPLTHPKMLEGEGARRAFGEAAEAMPYGYLTENHIITRTPARAPARDAPSETGEAAPATPAAPEAEDLDGE